jgi:hypothetical protein
MKLKAFVVHTNKTLFSTTESFDTVEEAEARASEITIKSEVEVFVYQLVSKTKPSRMSTVERLTK